MIVTAEIVDYGEEGDRPAGRIIEILGHPDDFGIDVEILIRAHHIPHQFPEDVLAQARSLPGPIPADEIARRRDFRAARHRHHRRRDGSRLRRRRMGGAAG